MKTLGAILLGFFPSFIQVPLRRMLGHSIGKGSKVKFGTLLISSDVQIGADVSIGPFCYIRSEKIVIGDHSCVKALSILSTRIIVFGEYVHIAPLAIIFSEFTERSSITIGDHSRVFPYSWLDTGEGITIGKQSSVGTHSLIYTHGTWSDYLNGAPIAYGPVMIEDNVWIPTRVTILPNVTIGQDTIIGANSLVNKSLPKNVLAGGSPARIIKENITSTLNEEQKMDRAREILNGFCGYINYKRKLTSRVEEDALVFDGFKIILDDGGKAQPGDLLMAINKDMTKEIGVPLVERGITVVSHQQKSVWLSGNNPVCHDFIAYLRRYGIRLYIHHK